MDLEGFTRRRIIKGIPEKDIITELSASIKEFKNWDRGKREEFAKAVLDEVSKTLDVHDPFLKTLIQYRKANISMGEFGVGSRGEGDFFVHREIAKIIGKTGAVIDPGEQDDAGVVKTGDSTGYITVAIDGMHSRLSDFPFLAGFHATRAAIRDVYVMGSKPIALISDLHLADDGDISKLFDFTAGVSAVSRLTNAPVIAGSTLRIGGDMVFGDRLVSAVAAVGTSSQKPKARKNAKKGDIILMTEGCGGGTITTIALYSGHHSVVKETLNIDFMSACETLVKKDLLKDIHAMTDITNGGIRGDAAEISHTSGKKLVFNQEMLEKTINKNVLEMLQELDIDPFGISTDSLMLILPETRAKKVKKSLKKVTKIYEVGHVETGNGAWLGDRDFSPLFRESPYTRIKKVIGEKTPGNINEIKEDIIRSRINAQNKRNNIINYIKRRTGNGRRTHARKRD